MAKQPMKAVDWQSIFDAIGKYGPSVLALLRQLADLLQQAKDPVMMAQGACPAHILDHVEESKQHQIEALAATLCLEHCLRCNEDEGA